MNKQHTLLTLGAAILMLAFSSCQKDRMGSTFTATLERYADINTKTYLDGNRLKWDAADQILVLNDGGYFGIYAATAGGDVTTDFTYIDNASGTGWDIDVGNPEATCYNNDGYPEANFFQAIYPASIVDIQVGGILLPATYSSPDGNLHGFPMYAYSTTNRLNFKNAFGLVKLTMQKANTTITSISVTADHPINGLFTIDNTTEWTLGQVDVPPLAYSSNGNNTTTLSLGTNGQGISINSEKDFYICLPPGDYSSLTFTFTNNEGGYCTLGKNTTTNIARSQYTAFNLTDNDPTDELLVFRDISGLFSIAPNQYIKFSPGNLQYSPSTNVWRFAPTQADMVGAANEQYFNGTLPTVDWIDLFPWGSSDPIVAITEYNINTGFGTFYEWGNSSISNSGSFSWRTPSISDWNYILFDRPNAIQKFGGATVAGVEGLIILPDQWVLPAGCTFNPGFQYGTFYNHNTYDVQQAQAMQAAGAVFLPAAGFIIGSGDDWVYSHTWEYNPDWDTNTSTGWDGLGEAIGDGLSIAFWTIIHNSNIYWSSTPFYDEDNVIGVNTNTAFLMGFSPMGLPEDIFTSNDASFDSTINALSTQIPEARLVYGNYVADFPFASAMRGAVRLVRDVVPGGAK